MNNVVVVEFNNRNTKISLGEVSSGDFFIFEDELFCKLSDTASRDVLVKKYPRHQDGEFYRGLDLETLVETDITVEILVSFD